MNSFTLSLNSLLPVLLLLLGLLSIHVDCLSFNFSTFRDSEDEKFFIKNNSYIVKNAIQVTPDVSGDSITNETGRIWYYKSLKLWRDGKENDPRVLASFTTTFTLRIVPRTVPGGEGLAFILTGGTDLPENSYGQWLGIVSPTANASPQNEIVAVEFDTKKSFEQDIDNNHVGVNVNSIYSMNQTSLSSYGINLSSEADITAKVQYDGEKKILNVFVHWSNDTGTGTVSPVLSVPIDLTAYLPKTVYVGFSASTGNETELNCIRSWEFEGADVSSNPNRLWMWVIIGAVVLTLFLGITCLLYWIIMNIRDRRVEIDVDIEVSSMAPKKFRLKELKKATANFNPNNKLGKGAFGTVFRGRLMNQDVAVKRTSKDVQQGKQEFLSEVKTIGNLHHKNLVKLLGWCYESQELLLVYEYMPNGSLDKLIYSDGDNLIAKQPTLNWERRRAIIRGIAQAVEYLHHGCEKRVIHRDIKESNIMLDSAFNPRLGDFGLARMIQKNEQTHHSTTAVAGTPGYMAPESFLTGRATMESDVYAFGVLLLGIVCAKQPGDYMEESNVVYWVWELHKKGRILAAVDSKLVGDFGDDEMNRMLVLGLACCHPNPHERPSMRMVLQILEGEAPVPVLPTERPAFVWPAMPPSFKEGWDTVADGQLTPITELFGR